MDFVSIYEKLVNQGEKEIISASDGEIKPRMFGKILIPTSEIIVNDFFKQKFMIDKDGMIKILKSLQEELEHIDSRNLMQLLSCVYNVTNSFLGGQGNSFDRLTTYMEENTLTLSDIENKQLGLCAERAAIANQCLVVLKEAEIIKRYIPNLVVTNLKVGDGKNGPHAAIILTNIEKNSLHILFDIENLLYLKIDEKKYKQLALYDVSQEELEKFENGETLSFNSLYERLGYEVEDVVKYFGPKEFQSKKNK